MKTFRRQAERGVHALACRGKLVAALVILLAGMWGMPRALAQTAPMPLAVPLGVPADVGIDQHLNAQLPLNLTFHDETGRAVQLGDLKRGKPIILVLIQYRCPSLCSVVLNDMLSTYKVIPQDIGNQYDVWTVSFDPAETPELAAAKKGEYVRTYLRTRPRATQAEAGWRFLTGDQENIRQLTHAVGFRYRWDAATGQFIHPAALIMLTPDVQVSRYFFGVDYDPTDLRLSLVEASNGNIGSLTDKVLLYCYHYDPATGKYGLAVTHAVQAGGAVTVLLLGGGMALLWRIDRRRTRRQLAAVPREGGPP